jgi:hypothetical protein
MPAGPRGREHGACSRRGPAYEYNRTFFFNIPVSPRRESLEHSVFRYIVLISCVYLTFSYCIHNSNLGFSIDPTSFAGYRGTHVYTSLLLAAAVPRLSPGELFFSIIRENAWTVHAPPRRDDDARVA